MINVKSFVKLVLKQLEEKPYVEVNELYQSAEFESALKETGVELRFNPITNQNVYTRAKKC